MKTAETRNARLEPMCTARAGRRAKREPAATAIRLWTERASDVPIQTGAGLCRLRHTRSIDLSSWKVVVAVLSDTSGFGRVQRNVCARQVRGLE